MSATAPSTPAAQPVLLFDGECGLCNRLVRLLLRLDHRARLRFAPLQGPAAQSYLRVQGLPTADFDTLVFVPDWQNPSASKYLLRSTGALAALETTGRLGRVIANILGIIPAFFRDWVYKLVGRSRYRLFGPWIPQPLPRPAWVERFLH